MTQKQTSESPKGLTITTEQVLDGVADVQLRADLRVTIETALETLGLLGRIHLPQDHFEGQVSDERYDHLAAPTLAAVQGMNRLLSLVNASYALPEGFADDEADSAAASGGELDFDFEFDLVDEGQSRAALVPGSEALSLGEQVAEAAHAYAAMLRTRVIQFAERLQVALQRDDEWPLLAELDDHRHRLTKAVQAVIFGVLRPCVPASTPVRREDILPSYQSLVAESVMLRTAVTDLAFQLGRFNEAVAQATMDTAPPLMVGIADHLERFCSKPPYRALRAADKKVVLDFRRDLYELRRAQTVGTEAFPLIQLRQKVEGYTRFLESLSAINHREALILHDQRVLQAVLEELNEVMELATSDPETAAGRLLELIEDVRPCYGRYPELDVALREITPETAITDLTASPTSTVAMLQRWMPLLQSSLAVSG